MLTKEAERFSQGEAGRMKDEAAAKCKIFNTVHFLNNFIISAYNLQFKDTACTSSADSRIQTFRLKQGLHLE